MITDDKRREVAAKLRGNPEDTHIPHRTGRHYGMGCHEAADRFWNMCYRIREAGNYDIAFSTTSVLADLIEPSIPSDPGEAGLASVEGFIREMRHSTKEEQDEYSAMLEKMSVGLHPVDRDALLGLAKELELGAQCFVGRKWLNVECERMAKHLADDYEMIACRIRKALGVEDGS